MKTLASSPKRSGQLLGRGVPGSTERAAARQTLASELPRALRQLGTARTAEQSALRHLERFRRNPTRSVVEAARRAKRILERAIRRLRRIDRRIAPLKRLGAGAAILAGRVGWRVASRLVPHPAYQMLRVASSLARTPMRMFDRSVER